MLFQCLTKSCLPAPKFSISSHHFCLIFIFFFNLLPLPLFFLFKPVFFHFLLSCSIAISTSVHLFPLLFFFWFYPSTFPVFFSASLVFYSHFISNFTTATSFCDTFSNSFLFSNPFHSRLSLTFPSFPFIFHLTPTFKPNLRIFTSEFDHLGTTAVHVKPSDSESQTGFD